MLWYNKLSPKGKLWLFTGLFSLLFIPFVALCFYAHPIADDYAYNPLSPFWESQKQLYLHWNGRYTANFMVMSNPILFHSLCGYRLVALGLLILIPVSLFFFLSCAIGGALSFFRKIGLSILLSLFIIALLPSLPEGIYWYPGAMTYILGCIMALVYAGTVILYVKGNFTVNRFIHFCLCIVLLFLSVGFNEVQMLLFLFGHTSIWLSLQKEERFRSTWFKLLLFCLVFSSVVFFSPGNAGRASFFSNSHHFIHSLGMTMLQMPRFFFLWASYTPLLLGSILFAPISLQLNKRSALFNKVGGYKPMVIFSFLWGILFLCIFPAYWSTGILGQHRTVNTACFFFIITWFVFMHTIYSKNNLGIRVTSVLTSPLKVVITLLLFATILFSGNCGTALMDFASGKITGFDKEMNSRYSQITEAKKQEISEITLKPLQNKPQSLFVLDIQPGCNHWINEQFAQFYGLKKICCNSTCPNP